MERRPTMAGCSSNERPVFVFVRCALRAYRAGFPAPSLLLSIFDN